MTIKDVFDGMDDAKAAPFSRKRKCQWLNQIENEVFDKIILTHEGSADYVRPAIDDTTDEQTELLVPDRFGELYIWWMTAKVDIALREVARFNNSNAMFQTAWDEYAMWYNRTHMPKQVAAVYF